MLARFSARLADVAQRVVPDPFVIALLLTGVAFALGMAVMPEADAMALASGWFDRFSASGTLTFTAQMALILVAGAALAQAPAVHGILGRLADIPRSTSSAAALTAFVAMSASLLNWGFGLIAGAVLAHQIGVRAKASGRAINYPLVGAAGYTGLLVWHGGLSGSAPLKVTEGLSPDWILMNGEPVAGIALNETLFSPLNLGVCLGLLVLVPWLFTRMGRGGREAVPQEIPDRAAPRTVEPERFSALGRLLGLLVVSLGVMALVGRLLESESWWRAFSLDVVILLLVLTGILLFGTPLRYGRAFCSAVPEAGGILLQFPFYFGILGILQASGLVDILARSSVDTARTLASMGLPLQWCFDVTTFFSAGLVNLFVPSGGGQWAVQGSILVQATDELGLPLPRAVMALSYGDEWTNMLQPFWALALLGITGLKARDILGYTMIVMLCSVVVYLGAFALL